MERRNFLFGLFALTAGSAAVAISGKVEAAPLAAPAGALAGAAPEQGATLPDGTPIEKAQYYRERYYRGRPPRYRRRREVCRMTRNRFGRPVRVCRTVGY